MSTPTTTAAVMQPMISAAAAQQLVQAAADAAIAHGKPMVVAVVDASGLLKAFLRMDGAPTLSLDIAIDKAWTAQSFGLATHGWRQFLDGDAGIAQIAHRPRLTAFGGGYPLLADGALIGGIGLSGGHYSDDQAVAEAALKACGFSV